MADFSSFPQLRRETIASIRARIDSDANAGLDPEDDRYLDTSFGGFWWDLTQIAALEIERLWDALSTEYATVAFLPYAFGPYLDLHGEILDLPRKDAQASVVTVRFTAPSTTLIPAGTRVAQVATDADEDEQFYETLAAATVSGTFVDVDCRSVGVGAATKAPAGSISILFSSIPAVTSVTNPDNAKGGADIESDDAYRQRLIDVVRSPSGPGTVEDFRRWALAWPGVGRAYVEPIWSGPGTVRVVISDVDGDPCPPSVVSSLQAYLDPTPGLGGGRAAIGQTVTVATTANVIVNITATVAHLAGYALDGTTGLIPTRSRIEAALRAYIDGLEPGTDPIVNHIIGQFFRVPGVYDVTLTAPSATVSVAALESARVGTITLT
jgi:uncharacterized phage protein gp47/JayE